jgi:transcriptional regulator with XRE-family HTH domain
VDPNIAFAQLLRQARIKARKTQREIQEAMGLPNKTSYTRLERRGNLTLSTISKVLEVFPDFPLMEALGK